MFQTRNSLTFLTLFLCKRSQIKCAFLRGPERAAAISTADKSRLLRRKLLAMTEKRGLQPVNGYVFMGCCRLLKIKEIPNVRIHEKNRCQ